MFHKLFLEVFWCSFFYLIGLKEKACFEVMNSKECLQMHTPCSLAASHIILRSAAHFHTFFMHLS